MECRLLPKNVRQIEPTNVLPQTAGWAEIKRDHGFVPLGFELDVSANVLSEPESFQERAEDDLLLLLKPIGQDACYAYVPYGPKLEPEPDQQGVFLEELSESLRPHLPSRCVCIRYDLMWQNLWAEDADYYDWSGQWVGPPPERTQEFRVNFNTSLWNLRKSADDALPKDTFFLDLKLSESDLLSKMRYNTRSAIRKSWEAPLNIIRCDSGHLDVWYRLYAETAHRHGLPPMDASYFASFLNKQNPSTNGVEVRLLLAEDGGDVLAGLFLVLSRNRGTYLFGASSARKRHRLASYALQWEAIRQSKQAGCTEYDMFGSAPNLRRNHPLHGVTVFKKGFGGKPYHRMGCWDYPFDQESYKVFRINEMQRKGVMR